MTRAELRALIRLTVTDTARWPDETLNAWIGQAIQLYAAHFGECAAPVNDTDPLAVPAAHLEALTAYVIFAASLAMLTQAAAESDGASIAVGQLLEQERRAWNRVKDVLNQLVAMTPGMAEAVSWPQIGL